MVSRWASVFYKAEYWPDVVSDIALHVVELNNKIIFDFKSHLESVSQSYFFFAGAEAIDE